MFAWVLLRPLNAGKLHRRWVAVIADALYLLLAVPVPKLGRDDLFEVELVLGYTHAAPHALDEEARVDEVDVGRLHPIA